MTSIEHKLLACAGNPDPDERTLQKIRGYMSLVTDARHLVSLAVKEGMAGLLYKALLKAGLLETINPRHQQRLYTAYYLTIRHNLKLIHTLNEILKPLMQMQIQVVLMQGISLLQQVYRDIGLRPMNDIDIWVMPKQHRDLVDCLFNQGFERNAIYPGTFSRGEVVLDIHTHFLGGDRIHNRELLINIGQEEIFKEARPVDSENTAGMRLHSADQFLYLSLHAVKHNLERLIWLVDIKSLVGSWEVSDWNALFKRAEKLGQMHTLFYMIFILRHVFQLKLPSDILSYFESWRPNFFECRVLRRRINGQPISTWSQLLLITAGKRLPDRISFIRETLFPRAAILRQVFPQETDSNDGRLLWKRILQILGSFKS
jgi:hypothetical protein